MNAWESTLELLRQRGWDYGYVKCRDTETGGEIYSVHLGRGTERLSVVRDTIEEAVSAINLLAEEADGVVLTHLARQVQTIWPQPRNHHLLAF